LLSTRDQNICQSDVNRKRCHFFNSFFMTKLLGIANFDADRDAKYCYRNVEGWSTRAVPGMST
jgi:Ulp1 family protease